MCLAGDPTGKEVHMNLARNLIQISLRKNNTAERDPVPTAASKRDFLVDVQNGQANIVEIVAAENRDTGIEIRRLREQYLTQAESMELERLKRKIVYGHYAGGYDQWGLYWPKDVAVAERVIELAQGLEQREGPQAWDRRRFPR